MDRLQWLAIKEFCQSCTLPVIAVGKKRSVIDGTGVLFEINNRKYFITAQHVAEFIYNHPDNYGIPVAKKRSGILSFKDCEIFGPKESRDKKDYDVAIIELTRNHILCESLVKEYQFLTVDNLGIYRRWHHNYLLAGFPAELSENITASNVLGRFFLLSTSPYTGEINDDVSDRESSVYLDYGKAIINDNGDEIDAPKLEGISGGSIWSIKTDASEKGIWCTEKNIELVAVDVSYMPDSFKHIRGVKWHAVAHAFGLADSSAKDAIINKLSGLTSEQDK